jgi:hypothetical protein
MLALEASSLEELDVIQERFDQWQELIWEGQTETYRGIMGLDPDGLEIFVSSSLTGNPITSEDWNSLDNLIYVIE